LLSIAGLSTVIFGFAVACVRAFGAAALLCCARTGEKPAEAIAAIISAAKIVKSRFLLTLSFPSNALNRTFASVPTLI
jgi:hypothetical protein